MQDEQRTRRVTQHFRGFIGFHCLLLWGSKLQPNRKLSQNEQYCNFIYRKLGDEREQIKYIKFFKFSAPLYFSRLSGLVIALLVLIANLMGSKPDLPEPSAQLNLLILELSVLVHHRLRVGCHRGHS